METEIVFDSADRNTQVIFLTLISAIQEALKDNQLHDLTLFHPVASDGYIKSCFDEKLKYKFDCVYFLCIEDTSKEPDKNFAFLDELFTSYISYLSAKGMTSMDKYFIHSSGTMRLANPEHICYYLTFCLEEDSCEA